MHSGYFNRLCHNAYAGGLGEDWAVFGGNLRENSALDQTEAESFLRDLEPGTLRYQEEGLGELVQSGAGLAFPMWSPPVHLTPWRDATEGHVLALGMDWGIRADSVVLGCLVGPQKELLAIREWVWRDKDAYEAGYDFAQSLLTEALPRWPEWMVCDSAMNERTGVGGTTILSEFQSGVNDALIGAATPDLARPSDPPAPIRSTPPTRRTSRGSAPTPIGDLLPKKYVGQRTRTTPTSVVEPR